jgi:hypothetical protein
MYGIIHVAKRKQFIYKPDGGVRFGGPGVTVAESRARDFHRQR